MEDSAPALKRRRTSESGSSSSRPVSRDDALPFRDDKQPQKSQGREETSRSRSRDGSDYDDTNRSSYRRRSRTTDYSPSRRDLRSSSRSQSQSRSRSISRSRSRSRTHSRLRMRSRSPSYHSSVTPPPPAHQPSKLAGKSLSFKPLHTLPRAHARGITSAKFSPDLSLLAVASADCTISIYTVQLEETAEPLKLLRVLRAHLAGINALAWSPIGPNYALASASDDKSILLWSPLSSDFPIKPSPLLGHSNYVCSLAFSPKGNMLVSGSYDEAVFLWDVRSARIMRQLPAHSDPVYGVDFLRDGSMVCSCASDGLIRIWDSGTGQCLKTLVDEDRKPVTSVRFTPNGQFVLGWGLDGCIRLWRYTEGRCVKTYMGHVNEEYSLGGLIGDYDNGREAFVVTASEDGDVVAWDVSSKEILWRGKGHKDIVLAVDFARDARTSRGLLVSAGKDRDLRLWIEEGDDSLFAPVVAQLNGTLKLEDSMDEEMMAATEGMNGDVNGLVVMDEHGPTITMENGIA